MAGAKHFHVLSGLQGMYMPDENRVYETRKEAEAGARSLAKMYRDDGERVAARHAAGTTPSVRTTASRSPIAMRRTACSISTSRLVR